MENEHFGYEPLIQVIREKINQGGNNRLSFYEYMNLCLYHHQHGYYMRNHMKIGKDGDFYTSASIGNVMGKMIARYVDKIWTSTAARRFTRLRVEEWGGGTGTLARHICDELKASSPNLYERLEWISIEKSDDHRSLQHKQLEPHLDIVRFEQESPPQEHHTYSIVLANELIDAFPVYRIKCVNGDVLESFVSWDKKAGFVEHFDHVQSKPLRDWLTKSNIALEHGQITEINTDGSTWLKRVSERLTCGNVLLIDYGDLADEIFSPHRMTGTLMCYDRHIAHDNPFINIGNQDMTTFVNFTDLMHVAKEANFTNIRYRTQKQFLLDEGILALLTDHESSDPFSKTAKVNRAVRQLLISDQMSERFKVLTMEKGQL